MRSARSWCISGQVLLALVVSACGGNNQGTCHMAGSYPITADDPEQVCCKGLTRLDVGSPGYADPALSMRICSPGQGSDRTYACLMGTCGDGVCESGEALPCGCPADCPSAVWGPASTQSNVQNVDAQAACSGIGYYTHQDGVITPPCCSGLFTLVQLRVAHLIDGQQRACFVDDPMSFACLTGSCGDGKCEAPEAIPCSCPVDCPSAVWEQEGSAPADAAVMSMP